MLDKYFAALYFKALNLINYLLINYKNLNTKIFLKKGIILFYNIYIINSISY